MAQQGTLEEGREAQFREMMEKFAEIQSKYRGVRGELLEKVREELMTLKPQRGDSSPVVTPASTRAVTKPARAVATPAAPARAAAAPAPEVVSPPPRAKVATNTMLPSCRSCGRTMREAADGSLVCQNGHVRALAS
jgi:hypothetical protein